MTYEQKLEKFKQDIRENPYSIAQKLVGSLFETMENDYRLIGNGCVDCFYDQYPVKFYNREHRLYGAIDVDRSKGIELIYSAEEMAKIGIPYERFRSEKAGYDYIFNRSFMEGYHGGAYGGPGHPSEGDPYWRAPYNDGNPHKGAYRWWGRPAAQSSSIENLIEDQLDAYLNGGHSKYTTGTLDDAIIEAIKDLINNYR